MTSFRSQCYSRYLSSGQAPISEALTAEKRAWYDHYYGPFLRDWPADATIVELGCGSGDFLAYLAERGWRNARGIDVSPEQIAAATARGLAVTGGDALELLRQHAGQCDAIVALDFLEHFSREELFALMPLVHAALRPGGHLLVQTPNGAGLFAPQVIFGDLTHLTVLTEESFRQLAVLHGFTVEGLAETGPVPQGWKGRGRWLLWRAFRAVFAFGKRLESGRWQQLWSATMIGYCRANGPSANQE